MASAAGRAEGAESDIALTREMCALVKKGVKSPKKAFKATFVVKVEKELLQSSTLAWHRVRQRRQRGGTYAAAAAEELSREAWWWCSTHS